MATDPVCKMEVKEEEAAARAEFRGRTYLFCSQGCRDEFEKDPERYASEEG